MKKYIACLLAAILLLTMLPASASAEGGMQACHRVTAKYTDSKQSNKSGIRLWSVKTALTSVDDEINGLAQAYADKIAPTLQAGKATGDKNSRLDVEIRHSKTGLTWMSFLVQARTTYHRDLIAQEFTSRTFDMTTGERILLTDIFPEGSEGWTMLREKLKAQSTTISRMKRLTRMPLRRCCRTRDCGISTSRCTACRWSFTSRRTRSIRSITR